MNIELYVTLERIDVV